MPHFNKFLTELYVKYSLKIFQQQKIMSQDRIDQQQQKNYARRSRKDQQGRDYVCGCGKSYLSYPALYTHIKTKHDGQKPQGTLKVNPTTTNRKISSTVKQNQNNQGAVGNSQVAGTTSPSKNNSGLCQPNHNPTNPPQKPPPPRIYKSRLPLQLLRTLQQTTTISDFPFITYLTQLNENVSGFTPPDDRIILQKVGQCIYEKYMEIVQLNKDKGVGDQFRIDRLGYRSQLQYAMVVYLLGAGRFVCEEVMEFYMDFCKMFKQCFTDHGSEVYEVCYKSKQLHQQKQREHQRQRDDPYKHYQYSYPPSSSKSKSYLAHTISSNSHSITPNIIIVPTECKYSPIICDFFARVFVPNCNKKQSYVSLMQLICTDFCGWMYKYKMTVVDVGLTGKYQVKCREEVVEELGRILVVKEKEVQNNTNMVPEIKQKKSSPGKQKQKRKQKPQKTKKQQKNPNNNENSQNSKNSKNNDQQQIDEQNQYPQDAHQNSDNNSQQEQNNHDQDSYKIRHQIQHQIGARDRSGSIHHYGHILGDNVGDVENQVQVQGGNRNGETINQEEIQQYINP